MNHSLSYASEIVLSDAVGVLITSIRCVPGVQADGNVLALIVSASLPHTMMLKSCQAKIEPTWPMALILNCLFRALVLSIVIVAEAGVPAFRMVTSLAPYSVP